MQYNITSKLPDLPTSIFTVMSSLAHKHDAVNLSQGFPDFSPDPLLIDLIAKAMKDGYNQYAPMAGIYSLREVISHKIKSLYGAEYHPESEITVTAGATQAIYTAIAALVSTGDEVIVLKPAYDCYEPVIWANGGIPVPVQLQGKTYQIDWDLFRSKITERTKMVVINTPHNPSGRVFSAEDMHQLQQSLEHTDILVLSDEVYEHLVFDDNTHQSVSKFPGLAERSLVCASFGKTFHSTGWKMGYCAAPQPLMKEFQKIHEFNVFCVNHPIQRALAVYLEEPKNYLDLGPFFQQKRDHFLNSIRDSRFSFTPSQGTYFQLLDYSAISDESDVDLAHRLTVDHKLASIPISVFNSNAEDHSQLRFCFAKTTETLDKATAIINTL
ncbi:methionine aminotransferase [Poritiphilus flavus]|uniref:Aminotransferase class I/II-fold pyridoxal phosphate-dependent enzyme n=1 Tax=Poritiphilus flavus TaxID=2697053 RepID=A0A6L9E7Y9_9FLAO|nr:methionine aminotransferase [Poritiphilus flavus]NAS10905.1 aminotransferase class I/II-fold pyridoxal phosphate-dependent enzyme [Poritiphilus flavus]